jgi:CIC family chloride channel protein
LTRLDLISRAIQRESIYTLKLVRRGVHLEQGQEIDVMQGVTIGEAMTTDADVVPVSMSLEELADEFARTHHYGFPVVDTAGELAGVVSIRDLEQALEEGLTEGWTVAEIATTKDVVVVYPHEMMWTALRWLGTHYMGRLPVVEREGSRRLVGVVRRGDIIHAYNRAITEWALRQHRAEVLRLGRLDSTSFVHIEIPFDSAVAGQRISDLELPKKCLIVSVRRGRKLLIARDDTVLHGGDRLTVFADSDCLPGTRQCLMGESVVNEGKG